MSRNSFWLTGGFLARNVALIATLSIVSKFLGISQLGQVTLALAITTPIFVVAECGLRAVYLTIQDRRSSFKWFLQLRLFCNLCALSAALLIGFLFVSALLPIVLIISLIKFFDSISELASAPLQESNQTSRIFFIYALSAILSIASVYISVSFSGSLILSLLSLSLVSFLTALAFCKLSLSAEHLLTSSHDTLKNIRNLSLIKVGFPIGATSALLALVSTIPQYLLANSWGDKFVGVFSVTLYTVVFVELVFGAVSQAWIPEAKRMYSAESDFFIPVVRVAKKWLVSMALLSIPLLLLASLVLRALFNVELQPTDFVPLYFWALLTPVIFFTEAAINIKNAYAWNLLIGITAVLGTLFSGVLLIPTLGILGALYSSVIGISIRAISALVILKKAE